MGMRCIARCIENRSKCVETARNRPIQRRFIVPRVCSAIQLYSARVYSRAIQDTAYTLYSPIRRPSGGVDRMAIAGRAGPQRGLGERAYRMGFTSRAPAATRTASATERGPIPGSQWPSIIYTHAAPQPHMLRRIRLLCRLSSYRTT